MKCHICDREVSEATAVAVSLDDKGQTEPVDPYLGTDPAEWAWTIGPKFAKAVQVDHKILMRSAYSLYEYESRLLGGDIS